MSDPSRQPAPDASLDRAAEPLTLELAADVQRPEAGSILEVTALDGRQICLARLAGGELTAFEHRCPHRGAPLCHGVVEGELVICLEHFWRWRARGGEPLNAGHSPLRTYRVEDRGTSLKLVPSGPHPAESPATA